MKISPTIIWSFVAVLCAGLIVVFTLLFLKPYYKPAEQAIAEGARVEIDLKTGEVKQAAPKKTEATAEAKPEEKKEEVVASDKTAELPADAKEGAATAPVTAEADKVAEGEAKDKVAAVAAPPAATAEAAKATEEKNPEAAPATVMPEKPAAEAAPTAPAAEEKPVEVTKAEIKKPVEAKKPEEKKPEAKVAEAPKAEAATPAATAPAEAAKETAPVAAAPVAEAPKGPKIAVVIVGAGLSRSSTELMLKLPSGVSISFSPYASDLQEWIKKASGENHEVYLDIPMEPQDYPYSDPGPYALLSGLDDAKNAERLKEVLSMATGYHGIIAGPEERFTERSTSVDWLFGALKERKLSFTYVTRSANFMFTQQLEKMNYPAQSIDIVMDARLTNIAIDARLADAEALAKKSGFAVLCARPYPISVDRIDMWLKTLEAKGIHLVPLSQAESVKE